MAPQQSQRRRRERRDMDVKVLYTLDSSPNSTMVAHLGRPMPIELLPASRGSSSNRSGAKGSASQAASGSQTPTPRFGTVTLKTCLSAICIASPELIFDERKDHILYAVDPLETYRNASQRTAALLSSPPKGSSSSSRTQQASLAQRGNATPGHSSASTSSVLVGKGFFSWALAEAGDGTSVVTGIVRGSYLTSSEQEYDDEDDGYDDEELEVVLRLKETPKQSREQYFDLVRAFNPGHDEASHNARKRRAEEEPARAPAAQRKRQASSDAPAVQRARPSEKAPAAAASQAARLPLPNALNERNIYNRSSPVAPAPAQPLPVASTSNVAQSPLMQNPAALQLLQMLQQLQAQQAGASPAPVSTPNAAATPTPADQQQTAQLMAFLGPLVSGGTAASPVSLPSGGAAPAALDGFAAEASANVLPDAMPQHATTQDERQAQREDAALADRQSKCCYNCGVRGLMKWLYVELPGGAADVRHRDGSDASGRESRGHKSDAQLWRACNPCGKHLRSKGESRPQHLIRKRRPAGSTARPSASTSGKRNADDESDAAATDAITPAPGAPDLDEQTLDSPAAAPQFGARAAGLPRTLSEVCERDVKRLKSGGDPVIVDDFQLARLKDYVRDQHGNLRTKRSVLENPSGERPGRPKGRKTGSRQRREVDRSRPGNSAGAGFDEQQTDEQDDEVVAASSPGIARPPALNRSRTDTRDSRHAHNLVAQSSPVRPSMSSRSANSWAAPQSQASLAAARRLSTHLDVAAPASAFVQPSAQAAPTPSGGRSSAQVRSLLQPASSPGTAFQTLLSEGDFDWSEIANTGSRFTQLSPVRRSPRKQPHGTQAPLNPYASTQVAPDPHQALWTSSDAPEAEATHRRQGAPGTCSSSVTTPDSPCSPSPARARKQQGKQTQSSTHTVNLEQLRLGNASWAGQGAISATADGSDRPNSPSQSRKAARQARAAAAAGPSAVPSTSSAQHLGPFMGLNDLAQADLSDSENVLGNASPTLGRTRRRKADGTSASVADLGASISNFAMSSSPLAFPEAEGIEAFDEWGRTASTRAFFPTPSPVKPWTLSKELDSPSAVASGSTERRISPRRKEAAAAQALHESMPPPPPVVGSRPSPAAGTSARTPAATSTQHIARRPLPATVEDAPSTSAASSPPDAISPEDYMDAAELFAQFEDPGGLLAAHGISMNGNGSGISADMLSGLELHSMLDFGQHLRQFTQEGATGVAAAVGTLANVASTSGAQQSAVSNNDTQGANAATTASSPSTPSKKSRAIIAAQTTPRARTRSQANVAPDTASPFTAFMTSLSHVGSNTAPTPSGSAAQPQFAMPSLTSPSFNFAHGDAQHSGLDLNALIASINQQQQLDRATSYAALTAPETETDEAAPAS